MIWPIVGYIFGGLITAAFMAFIDDLPPKPVRPFTQMEFLAIGLFWPIVLLIGAVALAVRFGKRLAR